MQYVVYVIDKKTKTKYDIHITRTFGGISNETYGKSRGDYQDFE